MLFLKDREMYSNSLGIEQGRTTRTICGDVTYPKFKYLTTGPMIVFENKILQFSNMPEFILLLTVGVILLNFSVNATFFGFEDNAFIATVYAQSDLWSNTRRTGTRRLFIVLKGISKPKQYQ